MAPPPPERDNKLVAGMVFFSVCAILALAGACLIWPSAFFAAAFSTQADLTPAMLLRAALSLALAIGGLEFFGALVVIALSDR